MNGQLKVIPTCRTQVSQQLKAPRFSGFDDDTGLIKRPDLARDVIRHLFKKKCEREQAERLARAQWQAIHENKCYYLKMDPAVTPMFPEVSNCTSFSLSFFAEQ